jgi:hypothetical protein
LYEDKDFAGISKKDSSKIKCQQNNKMNE